MPSRVRHGLKTLFFLGPHWRTHHIYSSVLILVELIRNDDTLNWKRPARLQTTLAIAVRWGASPFKRAWHRPENGRYSLSCQRWCSPHLPASTKAILIAPRQSGSDGTVPVPATMTNGWQTGTTDDNDSQPFVLGTLTPAEVKGAAPKQQCRRDSNIGQGYWQQQRLGHALSVPVAVASEPFVHAVLALRCVPNTVSHVRQSPGFLKIYIVTFTVRKSPTSPNPKKWIFELSRPSNAKGLRRSLIF